MNRIEKIVEQNNEILERHHREEFKDIARAMENEEKYIVLKTIPSSVLIDELKKRMMLLEETNNAVKMLFKVQG